MVVHQPIEKVRPDFRGWLVWVGETIERAMVGSDFKVPPTLVTKAGRSVNAMTPFLAVIPALPCRGFYPLVSFHLQSHRHHAHLD